MSQTSHLDEHSLLRPGASAVPRVAWSPATGGERAEEDRRLLVLYHRHGDQAARAELVARFLPLARQLARRYRRGQEPLEDLVQVASIGLVKAVDRFDPSRGTAFSSYAVPTITGELKRYFRDAGWAVHVPRGMQERVMRLNGAVARLSRDLGRSPTAAELGEAVEASPEEVLEAMEAGMAYDAVSLDASRGPDDDSYAESLGEEDERFDMVEYEAVIAPELRHLPPRDRVVIHLRFTEDMTQSEIAKRIGVSQMHVSRLIRRALARLRDSADAEVPGAQ